MKITIGVSNRHIHLKESDLKVLFGDEYKLEKQKDLTQPKQFASTAKLTIKTDKSEIDGVRVLGPVRDYTQVEISKTDAYSLGLNPPIRESGDLEGAEEITVIGPTGEITKKCCIIPNRHIHISPEQMKELGLKDKEKVFVAVGEEKKALLDNVYIKETKDGVLELHLDTDDGNGNLLKTGDYGELIID